MRGSFQVTDIKTAYISAVGQGFLCKHCIQTKTLWQVCFLWWWNFKTSSWNIHSAVQKFPDWGN